MRIETLPDAAWRVLSAETRPGDHHVFVDVYGVDGADLRDTDIRVRLGWEGMQPDETPAPFAVGGKPSTEPACSIPLWPGQRAWVAIDGALSERVSGLAINDLTSFVVRFQATGAG